MRIHDAMTCHLEDWRNLNEAPAPAFVTELSVSLTLFFSATDDGQGEGNGAENQGADRGP